MPGCRIVNPDGSVIVTPNYCRSDCPKYGVGLACQPADGDPCMAAPPSDADAMREIGNICEEVLAAPSPTENTGGGRK